jgi:ABC-type glycerol-3-phosphate transport system permease component
MSAAFASGPSGARPHRLTPARIGVYAFLVITALFFLAPLYVMVVTSLKSMEEIRLSAILALPRAQPRRCRGRNDGDPCFAPLIRDCPDDYPSTIVFALRGLPARQTDRQTDRLTHTLRRGSARPA